jgi:tripartite-type tricarboxylate transporter receptor subunit TctC
LIRPLLFCALAAALSGAANSQEYPTRVVRIVTAIPYKGNGLALNALVAGEIQVMFPNAASAMPHVRSGRIRVEPIGNTPEELARTIRTEMLRLGKVIAATGMKAE